MESIWEYKNICHDEILCEWAGASMDETKVFLDLFFGNNFRVLIKKFIVPLKRTANTDNPSTHDETNYS